MIYISIIYYHIPPRFFCFFQQPTSSFFAPHPPFARGSSWTCFFSEIWSERWAVRLGSTQTTTNTKILGTYPIWQIFNRIRHKIQNHPPYG